VDAFALGGGRGHKDVVKLLLASKADVNAKDNAGRTPLQLAMATRHTDVAELLRTRAMQETAAEHKGIAKSGLKYQIKTAGGSLYFETNNEIRAAFEAGKVAACDVIWRDGLAYPT